MVGTHWLSAVPGRGTRVPFPGIGNNPMPIDMVHGGLVDLVAFSYPPSSTVRQRCGAAPVRCCESPPWAWQGLSGPVSKRLQVGAAAQGPRNPVLACAARWRRLSRRGSTLADWRHLGTPTACVSKRFALRCRLAKGALGATYLSGDGQVEAPAAGLHSTL